MFTTLLLAAAFAGAPADNATCPVLGNKVGPKSPTVAVRGREYRICCKGCDAELIKHPDKYLEKDGTPKNARRAPAAPKG